ncbi:unnamed protein product [Lampetra planeri]
MAADWRRLRNPCTVASWLDCADSLTRHSGASLSPTRKTSPTLSRVGVTPAPSADPSSCFSERAGRR